MLQAVVALWTEEIPEAFTLNTLSTCKKATDWISVLLPTAQRCSAILSYTSVAIRTKRCTALRLLASITAMFFLGMTRKTASCTWGSFGRTTRATTITRTHWKSPITCLPLSKYPRQTTTTFGNDTNKAADYIICLTPTRLWIATSIPSACVTTWCIATRKTTACW